MKRIISILIVGLILLSISGDARGRGFGGGGFRGFGGGGGFGGDRFGGFSGGYDRSFGGYGDRSFSSFGGADRYGGSYSGSRYGTSYSGWGDRGYGGSYDHTWTDSRGGSINTSGNRGFVQGPLGGFAAGGNR